MTGGRGGLSEGNDTRIQANVSIKVCINDEISKKDVSDHTIYIILNKYNKS